MCCGPRRRPLASGDTVSETMTRPIAILYEHPGWFKPLFAELERRDIRYDAIDLSRHRFDPGDLGGRYSLVVNRMSPSAWTRGHANAIFHTLHYLGYLEELGVPTINGQHAYRLELSKALQCSLFARLGVPYPRTRVINHRDQARAAAEGMTFPVLVKPNVGGSGAGIQSFTHPDELEHAELDLGLDSTALVQEQLSAEGESIVRIEILDGEFLYAIRILLVPGSFNLCPADYCELPGIADGVSGRGLPVEAFDPPAEVIEDAKRIVATAGMDVAGVEYLVNGRDGQPTFYDLNALSNFVADAPSVVGFDPFERLVDLIADRAAIAAPVG
jgi:RimK-like ATP-grasp domain